MLILTTIRRLFLPVIAFLAWAPAAHAWSWPVQGPVLEPFVYDQAHPYAAGQHRGIDIGADGPGKTVVAPAAGTVAFAGTVPTSGTSLTIETPDGYSVTLTHLGSIVVSKGAAVAEGEAVGTIGPSGTPEVDGPYVHLGIRVTADSNGYVDPLGLLPAATAASPPAESAPPAQPTAGGSTSATPPAPAPAASTPAVSTGPSSTAAAPVAPTRIQVSRDQHDRAQRPRVEHRPRPSSERPALRPAQSPRPEEHRGRLPHRRPSKPKRASGRAVVEAAAPREATVLDAGPEIPSSRDAAQPRASSVPLPLVLNGAAALVALAAAFAASRRRSRPRPAAEVLELPRPVFERRRAA